MNQAIKQSNRAVACTAWLALFTLFVNLQPRSDSTGFEYIHTSFENASPCYWKIDESGAIHVFLVYDHERSSPNRANGHWHFQVQAKPGSNLTLVLHNFENVWNGRVGIPVSDKTVCFTSYDGKTWQPVDTEFLDGNLVQLTLRMEHESIYVARLEPYRISDLEAFKNRIFNHSLVHIETIGRTVEGRELEIVRVGRPAAPYRVLLRARAHAWEPGGNWVVQGLIDRLLRQDRQAESYLDRFCVYVLPMANKDGVARGRTRFNSLGKDLNRDWDAPADPALAPENHALEQWIDRMIRSNHPIHFAIDFHNDEGGKVHVSRPNIDLERYLTRMERYERLLRSHTWFTEGSTGSEFRNPGTIGEGLLERFGITACVHELNANWIAGLNDFPTAKNWELFGAQLCEVFYRYFQEEEQFNLQMQK